MRIKILLILMLLIFPVFANASEKRVSFKDIVSKLPALNDRNCKFSQVKTLPNGIVFNSSGDFEFNKNKGITFYTTYPVKTVSYSQNFTDINDIIQAISTKSCGRLEKDFNLYYDKNDKIWTLGLVPKHKSKARNFVKRITIEGSKEIDKIIIINTDETKTEITYYQ